MGEALPCNGVYGARDGEAAMANRLGGEVHS